VKEWGWTSSNPVNNVHKPRLRNERIRFLMDEERSRLLECCRTSENPNLYPVVLIALSTGARYGEIINLRWTDIDFDRAQAMLMETKNGDRRRLFLSKPILVELRRLKQSSSEAAVLVFPSQRKPNKPIELRKAWLNALKAANVEQFRFHDLRHTAASYLAMNGATLAELSEILGHRTFSMVKRYAHLSDSHTRQVVYKMNAKLFEATQDA
jgi:integrase